MRTTAAGRSDPRAVLAQTMAQATRTCAEDWYLVHKARLGMAAVMAALQRDQDGAGGVVLTQAFTCLTALTPVLASGLRPLYADIDPDTLSVSASTAHDAVEVDLREGERVSAVVVQHTFGILNEQADRALARWAGEHHALLMEDSAHAVARMARGQDGHPLAEVSVHSFGVQKILPTHVGGAVWVSPRLAQRDPVLDALVRGYLSGLPEPTPAERARARLYRPQTRVLAHLPVALAGRLRAAGESSGCYEPPVQRRESDGALSGAPARISRWEAQRGVAALAGLEERFAALRTVVSQERDGLAQLLAPGRLTVPQAAAAGAAQPLLRLPLLVGPQATVTPDALITSLRSAGVYAEPWGRPLLYPGVTDPAAFGLDPATSSRLRHTQEVSRQVVALPTELGADQVARLLRTVTDLA